MKLKNVIYYAAIVCIAIGCKDENFAEGSITTESATEITMTSAILHGNIGISTKGNNAQIVRRGFVFGTNPNGLSAEKGDISFGMIYEDTGVDGDFSGKANGLSKNTKYYAKAFCVLAQTDKSGGQVYFYQNKAKLVYVFDVSRILSSGYVSEEYYCDVLVFYGNTIEFQTEDSIEPEY